MTDSNTEIREQLHRLIIENQSDDGSIDISDRSAMADEILELIATYTQRKEIEARIDEVASNICCHHSQNHNEECPHITNRLNELTKELEI
jgi:hypothetical protein